MNYGPIGHDWGEGWDNFDDDLPDPVPANAVRPAGATVTRMPRARRGRRGDSLDCSITAPRPTSPDVGRSGRASMADVGTIVLPTGPTPRYGGTRAATTWDDDGLDWDDGFDAAAAARTAPSRAARAAQTAPPLQSPDVTARAGHRSARSTGTSGMSGRGWSETAPSAPRLRALAGGGSGGRPPRGMLRHRASSPERRSLVIKTLLAVLLLAVVGRLVTVQVFDRDTYVAVGEEQRLRTVTLDASRGRILDREGHDLALSVLRMSVFADPSQIEDPAAAAALLAPLLDLDVTELTADLSRDSQFVYLSRRIDDSLAERVVELGVTGVHLHEEPSRFTPSDDIARAIVGKVADDQTGSTGIEKLYDDVLTGTPGELSYERARDGGTIASAGQSLTPAVPGDDVVLTLDRSLQYETERVLAEQVDAMGAKGGIVIIADPKSGEILSLANITRNDEDQIITAGANRAVVDVFEPGSVNKVITIAAALEEGLVEPESALTVPWRYQVSDHQFSDDHSHPTAPMTVTDILAESSNVGTIMLAQQLGKDRVDSYLRKFGFGSKTALDFDNESAGLLKDLDNWSGTDIGSVPIGQGIAVTAMQMLDAYNVIANDGVYVAPRLVAATVDGAGTRTATPVLTGERVVSAETARQVREMLVAAVDTGTGVNAQVPGYSVGGKTGTARKPQNTGTYRDEAGNYHYVAAFSGMVPAENPELSIIVAIDEPTATIYGGSAAAPVFADLASFALNRFRIPPASATSVPAK